MKSAIFAAFLLAAAPGVAGSALRRASPHATISPKSNASATSSFSAGVHAADEDQVRLLRAKLVKVSSGFSALLNGKVPGSESSFSKTMAGATMAKVEAEVQAALRETEHAPDAKKALQRLRAANAAVQQMSKDLDAEQAQLMHENDEQEQSLLLGVLMTKQHASMDEQLKILRSPDFAKLPAVIAVLAAKDAKTPLFQQVAAYLDAHAPPKKAEPQIPDELTKGKDGKPDVTPIVLALQARVRAMVENEQRAQERHQEEMMSLDRTAEEHKNNTRMMGFVMKTKSKDTREFAKQYAMAKHDIHTMESAIESVKKGDMAGLVAAQKAMDASQAAEQKAAQVRSGHFLVLMQAMSRAGERDCPYCVAQCVGKCHSDGQPYATCLTTCADAGK